MRKTSLLIVLLLATSFVAAEEPRMQVKALDNTPIDQLTALANSGNPAAQTELASLYFQTSGKFGIHSVIPHDTEKALQWAQKAANQGFAPGEALLGDIYLYPLFSKKDAKKAFLWLSKAVEQNDLQAEYRLGWMYEEGIGMPQDKAKAIQLLRASADQIGLDNRSNTGWQASVQAKMDLTIRMGIDYQYPTPKLIIDGLTAAGATLVVNGEPKEKLDAAGHLEVTNLAASGYNMRLVKDGYTDWMGIVVLKEGDTTSLNVSMSPMSASAAQSAAAANKPFSEEDILKLLKAGVTPRRAATLVGQRGVDFSLDATSESNLRNAGADDNLVQAIRSSHR